jgi:hypothetical protein
MYNASTSAFSRSKLKRVRTQSRQVRPELRCKDCIFGQTHNRIARSVGIVRENQKTIHLVFT